MGEWWAAAVAAAGEQPPADLPAAAAEELIALWSDLGEAIRRAAGRSWSVECDGLVVRIVTLSRAHHGDAVAVDTGAAAGQRRLSRGAGVSGHRLHPAVHGRDLRRGPPGRDRRAARRHQPPLSCPAAPCPTRAGRALEPRFALACRSRGPRRSAGSSLWGAITRVRSCCAGFSRDRQAALWYSLISPLTVVRRLIRAVMSMASPGLCMGG